MNEISMDKVLKRRLLREEVCGTSRAYPLLFSYKEKYNYNNLKQSITNWKNYSPVLENCITKMLELFDIVSRKGTPSQISECVDIVSHNISNVKDTKNLRSQVRLMENTEPLMNIIEENEACDTIIKTHNDLCKRFRIDEYVQRNHYDNIDGCIYSICEFVDTYNMGLNSKFRIALNEAQYAFRKNKIRVSDGEILENVADYFIFNHMDKNDWDGELFTVMENVIKTNPFIYDYSYIIKLKEAAGVQAMYADAMIGVTESTDIESLNEAAKASVMKDLSILINTLPPDFKKFVKNMSKVKDVQEFMDKAKDFAKSVKKPTVGDYVIGFIIAFLVSFVVAFIVSFSLVLIAMATNEIVALIVGLAILCVIDYISYTKANKNQVALALSKFDGLMSKAISSCKNIDVKNVLSLYVQGIQNSVYKFELQSDMSLESAKIITESVTVESLVSKLTPPYQALYKRIKNMKDPTRITNEIKSLITKRVKQDEPEAVAGYVIILIVLFAAGDIVLTGGTATAFAITVLLILSIILTLYNFTKFQYEKTRSICMDKQILISKMISATRDPIVKQNLVQVSEGVGQFIKKLDGIIASKVALEAAMGIKENISIEMVNNSNLINIFDKLDSWDYDSIKNIITDYAFSNKDKGVSVINDMVALATYMKDKQISCSYKAITSFIALTAKTIIGSIISSKAIDSICLYKFDDFSDKSENAAYLNNMISQISIYAGTQSNLVKVLGEQSDIFGDKMLKTRSFNETVSDPIAKFKALPVKTFAAFKSTVQELLNTKREEDIADESGNILALAFYFFIVVGSLAISLIGGAIVFIAVVIIANLHNKNETKKVLKKWHANRAKAAKRLDKETDPDKQERLKEYLKGMDKGIAKIEDHYDTLVGYDEKYASELRPKNYNGSKPSEDDDFDFDMNFDEATVVDIGYLVDAISVLEEWDVYKAESSLISKQAIMRLPLDNIEYLTEFACKYPDMLSSKGLARVLNESVRELRRKPTLENYIKINVYNQCKAKLNESHKYKECDTIDEAIVSLNELYNFTNNTRDIINELSVGNTISMAVDKAVKGLESLDVKQQAASRAMDSFARRIDKAVKGAFTLESRTAVVRDDILPSMSKCIKLMLVGGALFLVNPFLAIVGLGVGMFKRNKEMAKERQQFVNELDVELTMVEKYIQQAEEDKDMEKLRKLLLLKKKLQAHYAKMKFNMDVEYNDDSIDNARGHFDRKS